MNKRQQRKQESAFGERIRNTQFPVKEPRQAFIAQLFESLKHERAQQTQHSQATTPRPEHAQQSTSTQEPLTRRFSEFFAKPAIVGGLSFAVLAVLAFGVWQILPGGETPTGPGGSTHIAQQHTYTSIPYPEDGNLEDLFTLEAVEETENGIVATTAFKLTSAIEFTEEQLTEAFSFKPAVAYAAELTEEQQYLIRAESAFQGDSLVTAQMNVRFEREDGTTVTRTYSWTYQVEDTFKLNSTFPQNRSNQVPANSTIEIDLSHSDVAYNEDLFSVEPALTGRVEQHRSRLVFIPDTPMQQSTVYTVTLNSDITQEATGELIAAGTQFQFETTYGDSDEYNDKQFRINRMMFQVASSTTPSILLDGDYGTKNPVNLQVFSMSRDQYASMAQEELGIPGWAHYADEPEANLEGLTTVLEAEVDLKETSSYGRLVEFPDTLSEGYYYAQVTRGERIGGVMLQVSDISAFNAVSRTDTVVWAHDASTSEPISNAEVAFINAGAVGSTGQNGLMQAATPAAALAGLQTELLLIESGESELLLPLTGSLENSWERVTNVDEENLVTPVRSFMHTSKPFYKPTDTLSAWGTIRAQDFTPLGEVSIALTTGGWRDTEVIYTQVVHPDEYGTYEVHMPLGGLQPDTYRLEVHLDGVKVRSTYVEVLNYQLPAYTVSVSPARLAVFAGDSATHTISATLYDGTPLAATDIRIGGYEEEHVHTTGSDGTIEYTQTYQDDWHSDTYSHNFATNDYISVTPAEGEQGDIRADFEVVVFPSALGAKFEALVENESVTASGTVHTVDLDKYNNGEAVTEEDALTDTVPKATVGIKVIEHWTTKKETGTEYDPVSKKTITRYRYKNHDREFHTDSIQADSDGAFEYTVPNTDKNRDYEIIITVQDDQGRAVSYSRWAYQQYESDTEWHLYSIQMDDTRKWSNDAHVAVGETATARMLDNEQLLPEGDSYLFVQARNGIRETATQQSPIYEFEFQEEDVPSVTIMGVWYDGTGYWATPHRTGIFERGARAVIDVEDKALEATVEFDQEQYGPGDTVVMDLEFVGGETEREETAIHVVAIDEALFDLRHTWTASMYRFETDKYFAESYYRGHNSGIYGTYSSHQELDSVSGVEGGGGGDKRTNFDDQAAFITTRTGDDGKVQVQFELPDALTSWNVIVYAIDGEQYIAEEVRSITTTLPVQATAVLNDVYQSGDKPEVKVRAYGTALSQDEEVVVTLESEDLGIAKMQHKVQGSADAYFELPALPVGTHRITYAVEAGEHTDVVERSITVRPSLQSVPTVEQVELEAGEWTPDINALYGAEITVTDKSIGQFYSTLRSAYWTSSDRLDFLAARQRSTELIAEWFDESVPVPAVDYSLYQQDESGGLQLFTYGGIDLYTSVLVTAALEGEVDSHRLTRYYNNIFDNPEEGTRRHAQALAGLATLRQPVLNEAEQMLAHEAVTDADKVYIAYALARMGAFDEARAVMTELNEAYFAGDAALTEDAAEAAELDSIAAITMALIQMDGADELFRQFMADAPDAVVRDVAAVEYVAARISHVPMEPATVTYIKDGVEETVALEPGQSAGIRLSAQQLEEFRITSHEGALVANMEYQAVDAELVSTMDGVTITREADWENAREGDVLPVTIRVQGAPEHFTIIDTIPAGFRVITNPMHFRDWYSDSEYAFPYSIDQQQAKFCGCNDSNTYRYYVQAVQPGAYTAGAPMIQNVQDPTQRAFGTEETIRLNR